VEKHSRREKGHSCPCQRGQKKQGASAPEPSLPPKNCSTWNCVELSPKSA
jgi:hypothetical protein